jgi:hypothetical protein
MNDRRQPLDQIAERVAEAAPTRVLPFLAALNNMKGTWADSRRRVNDSHRAQMSAAGLEDIVKESAGKGDEMGDTIVTGDIQITQQPQPAAEPSKGLSTLGKLGVGAALLFGGAGAGIVANELLKDQTPAPPTQQAPHVDADTDSWNNSQFGIETK